MQHGQHFGVDGDGLVLSAVCHARRCIVGAIELNGAMAVGASEWIGHEARYVINTVICYKLSNML